MPKDLRIAILGAGRLGEALIRGLLDSALVTTESLRATVATSARAELLRKKYGLHVTAGSNRAAVAGADAVILAVKPGKVTAVLTSVGPVFSTRQIMISLAAAVPVRRMEELLPAGTSVFRAMPNIAMTVRQSATALCANASATSEQRCAVERMFRTVGSVEWVEESAMNAATGLSGSGPAFVFHMLAALTTGGDKAGLPKAVAYRLARQTLQGAARLAIETNLTPNEWIEQVKTPGGTTVEGLTVLEEAGVQEAFVEAVASASRRAATLSENL